MKVKIKITLDIVLVLAPHLSWLITLWPLHNGAAAGLEPMTYELQV